MKHVIIVSPWQRTAQQNDMLAAVEYPASWTEKNGQSGADITAGQDCCVVEGVVSDAQAAAIAADSRFAVLWNAEPTEPLAEPDLSATLSANDRDALRAKLASVYHDDVARLTLADAFTRAQAVGSLIATNRYPPWRAGIAVMLGQVYYFERNLYEVVQSHTTQAQWTPTVAVALWTRHYEIGGTPEPWRQPTGAHDAYRVGVRVTHNGFTWENTSPANAFAPGVFGWTNLTPPPATPAWSGASVAYSVNQQVTYNGSTYRCLQAHTSQAGWTPVAVPALWAVV